MKIRTLILFMLITITMNAEQPIHGGEITSLCGPIPAACYPITITGGLGIFLVSFNQIYNTSGNPNMLEDFTCSDSTWLVPGLTYNLQVTTGPTYEETLTAWIDFNNDGSFDSSEIIYHDSAVVYNHYGMVTIPSNVINTYTPLRMRVGSDYSGNPELTGCNNALYGQYEDYTIYFGTGSGIFEMQKSEKVIIAPNPVRSTALITLNSNSENSELFIFNIMGILVAQFSINNQHSILNRDGLPDGFYFYKITAEDNRIIATGNFITE